MFKLSHNTMEATKNICFVKDEGAIDQSTVMRQIVMFIL